MQKLKIFSISLFLLLATVSSNNSRDLAICQCQVRSNATAWGVYCTKSCSNQSSCLAYSAYCTWNSTTITQTCPNNCSGHGTCNTSTGVCTCSSGWQSANCSKPYIACSNNCSGHGTCNNQTGICTCSSGWQGTSCSTSYIPCSNNCNGHGTCNNQTGICTCSSGWQGTNCSTPYIACQNNCNGNGVCNNQTGSCTCNSGWQGTSCSTPYIPCLNNCNGNGVCNNQTGTCTCDSDWQGVNCDEPIIVQSSGPSQQLLEIYVLSWTAWNTSDIINSFQPACDGYADVILFAFGKPTMANGINYDGQSPSQQIWYQNMQQSAVVLYHDIITSLYQYSGVKTLLTIGGYTYQNDFAFLATSTASQILTWAQKVKNVVDSFGAQGIEIDYVANTTSAQYQTLVQNNVIGILRQVMPSPQYTIKVSLLYAAAMNYNAASIPSMYSPPLSSVPASGINVQLLQQSWNFIDIVAIQSFSNDPNLDPTTTLDLVRQSINSYLSINNAETKLELGGLIGNWTDCNTNWCNWQVLTQAKTAATWVKNNNFKGMFWWPNTGVSYLQQKPYYAESYFDLFGTTATSITVPGFCSGASNVLLCPNSCSGQGICNSVSGICTCNAGFQSADCSQTYIQCPNNCNGQGSCNNQTGVCSCYYGFSGNQCEIVIQDNGNQVSGTPNKQLLEVYVLSWSAWNTLDIINSFKAACDGYADIILYAFGKPTMADGINYDGQTPSQQVYYNGLTQSAVVLYHDIITGLYQNSQVKTLLSIGGWSYQNDFAFLATSTASQILTWAQKVKNVVDSFGAHGIEIDYEVDTASAHYQTLVQNNVIGILRQVMPAPEYIIKISLLYAAAMNYPAASIPSMYSPPIAGVWASGIDVQLIQAYWTKVDIFAIQSYANDQNLDPRTTLDLVRSSINSYLGISNAETKLELGGLIGSWPGCTTNWCNWQVATQTKQAATWVKNNNYRGMFWWPSSGIPYSQQAPYYAESYIDLFGTTATPRSVPGICSGVSSIQQCPNSCSNHGTCNQANGVCSCNSGWQGNDCSQVYIQCPNNCNYNGVCNNSTGTCTCYSEWSGTACDTAVVQSEPGPQPSNKQLLEIYVLSWTAWTTQAIIQTFKPACDGFADVILFAFGKPTMNDGINYNGQSPSIQVWYKNAMQSAVVLYKDIITGLYNAKGVKTILSIGGWSYQNDFAFLATSTQSQIQTWAQRVKNVVDSFGAHGIEIDYEVDTASAHYQTFVQNNVIGILRQVMPASQYTIKVSLLYAAAMNYPAATIPAMYSPPLAGIWAAGIDVQLIQQNWNDIDTVSIQSYANDPNLNPMTTLNLVKQSINSYKSISNAETKLELGGLIGTWTGCTTNWCNWQVTTHTRNAANWVKQNHLKGMFWWPSSGISYATQKPYYAESYFDLFGVNATPFTVPGIC